MKKTYIEPSVSCQQIEENLLAALSTLSIDKTAEEIAAGAIGAKEVEWDEEEEDF